MLRLAHPEEIKASIRAGWQVLDVGSGDRPFPYATVLVDRKPRTHTSSTKVSTENPTASIRHYGKPFVEGELEALPFGEKVFDFVVASHVLEHVQDPHRAVSELTRVAKRGYIECPRAWFEMVDSSPFHRWNIDFLGEKLYFRPKTEAEMYFAQANRLFDHSPEMFSRLYNSVFQDANSSHTAQKGFEKSVCHLCLLWEGAIPIEILPPANYLPHPILGE